MIRARCAAFNQVHHLVLTWGVPPLFNFPLNNNATHGKCKQHPPAGHFGGGHTDLAQTFRCPSSHDTMYNAIEFRLLFRCFYLTGVVPQRRRQVDRLRPIVGPLTVDNTGELVIDILCHEAIQCMLIKHIGR